MRTTEELMFDSKRIPSGLSRRSFLKRLGGGVTIAITVGGYAAIEGCTTSDASGKENFNAYLRIKEDGRVDCLVGKIEMGQSAYTSLKQLLAEELDVALESVDIIMGDTELCPYDAGTWGSLSIRSFGPDLRAGGAEGRAVLLELASETLKVPKDQLMVSNGIISAKNDKSKKISYSELTKGKQIVRTISENPPVKTASEFKVIGKSVNRHDAEWKVTGEAKFSADIQLPGMLYASIVRPPDHRAKLVSVDTSAAKNIPGVLIVNEGGLVAALHKDPEVADRAQNEIKAKWDFPESDVNDESIFDHLEKTGIKEKVVEENGNSSLSMKDDQIAVEERYLDGYKAHAPIEPHVATAMMEGDKLVMWASSQTPFGSKRDIAKELDMPEEKVHLKQVFLGGGFGGKIYNPQAIETAKLAKITGKPVQVAYTRREEFFKDYFRPAAVAKVKSIVEKTGEIQLWNYDIYYAGARGSQFFYETPNKKIRTLSDGDNGDKGHFFPTGAWRAPANNTNTFVRESQIDTMASQIGMDPLEFRLKNLKNEKMIRTLKLAADKFGWEPIKGPSGKGWGIACGFDAGTWVALIAEVEVNKSTGHVQVNRCVAAQDMGLVVNPHGAAIQAEGGITMGLGYALTEDIEFEGGKINSRNFDTYHITTFSMTPKIDIYFIDDPDSAPQGGGEPAIICAGGAVGNAIFDACGARLTRMPMIPERVLAAIGKV
ncbi:MAG: xanthine dehydrogenase family protein molybdopterin-binding subunit [Cyclobacteriaceae bacterium]|nr:xanthine dehydrogenase family protein molybdopterin-binding subunit [Cyclobacteriaceae bacterium]